MKKKVEKQSEIKKISLAIHDIEDNAIIVNIDGWRMRVYFEHEVDKKQFRIGQNVDVNYTGDIKNPHSIKFKKISS